MNAILKRLMPISIIDEIINIIIILSEIASMQKSAKFGGGFTYILFEPKYDFLFSKDNVDIPCFASVFNERRRGSIPPFSLKYLISL